MTAVFINMSALLAIIITVKQDALLNSSDDEAQDPGPPLAAKTVSVEPLEGKGGMRCVGGKRSGQN